MSRSGGRPRATAPTRSRRAARRAGAWRRLADAPMALGAALLVWSGAIHLHLWASGYKSVPTIGWLFLLQSISAFVLGATVLVTRHPVPAAAGALFLASTIGGLVWSVELSLFGFRDSFSAPFATESLGVESAGIVVLALASAVSWRSRLRRRGRVLRPLRRARRGTRR